MVLRMAPALDFRDVFAYIQDATGLTKQHLGDAATALIQRSFDPARPRLALRLVEDLEMAQRKASKSHGSYRSLYVDAVRAAVNAN